MKRLIVCISLVIVMVVPAAQAAKTAETISCRKVMTSFTTAAFNCLSTSKTKVIFDVGTDKNYGLLIPDRSGHTHQPRIDGGLSPDTLYLYTVSVALGGSLKPLYRGSFRTSEVGPATAGVSDGNITLNGSPFFPVIGHLSAGCPANGVVDASVAKGVNVIQGSSECPDSTLARRLRGKVWWIEGNQKTASRMALPELLRLKVGEDSADDVTIYEDGALEGGVNTPCTPDSAKGLAQAIQQEARAGKPVVQNQFLFKHLPRGRFHTSCLTPQRLGALQWTAVCGGAKGIESEGQGSAIAPQIQQAARQLAVERAVMGPVIFAPTVPVETRTTGPMTVCAHRYKGVTYVIAVNLVSRPVGASLTLSGVACRKALVWREPHEVNVNGGTIEARFEPFGFRLYVCR